MPKIINKQDRIGLRFGRLMLVKHVPLPNGKKKSSKQYYLCKCSCGVKKVVRWCHMKSGRASSCGCKNKEMASARALHRMSHTSEHNIWMSMIGRCTNPKSNAYRHYGGRGISVCERWLNSFRNFYKDMGPRPSRKHSIDRIDVNGNYEPRNVRWATATVQANNRRDTKLIEFNGSKMPLSSWARETGLSASALKARLRAGWAVKRALTVPSRYTCTLHESKRQNKEPS